MNEETKPNEEQTEATETETVEPSFFALDTSQLDSADGLAEPNLGETE